MERISSLFPIFFILISLSVSAQVETISIDFKKKSIGELPEIKKGNYYKIEVTGMNPNLWKISLNTKDSIITSPLQTPVYGDMSIESLTSLVTNLNDLTAVPPVLINEAFTQAIGMKDFNSDNYFNREKTIVERLNKEKFLLLDLLQEQNEFSERVDSLKLEVLKYQISSLDESNTINSDIELSSALAEITNLRYKGGELSQKIEDNRQKYLQFSNEFSNEIAIKKEFLEADKERKESYVKFVTSITALKNSLSAENSINLLKTVLFVRDKKETFTSLPIQFKGDQAKVKLIFQPRDPAYNLPTYEMPFDFPIKTKTYWSIGVSFYGSTLYDKNYSSYAIATSDSTNIYTLKQEEITKIEVGLGTLLRFGKKFKKDSSFGYHGSLGPGISMTNKIRPRILFGGGISKGTQHSISVDIGGIVGHVERISTVFNTTEQYLLEPENVTVSKLKLGLFFSIGYLFKL